jgi:hypothetical protein
VPRTNAALAHGAVIGRHFGKGVWVSIAGALQVARAFIIDQTLKIEILNSEAVKPQWHG